MKITIICVGKLKERYWKDAAEEYLKRLSRYCKTDVVEVVDEKTPDGASPAVEEEIRKKEAERIIHKIPSGSYVITLEISGKKRDSLSFADELEQLGIQGKSHLCFIIGGSLGLHEQVSARAEDKLSVSDMTFPHQMMRVILLEQIYRGYRIISNEPYHK